MEAETGSWEVGGVPPAPLWGSSWWGLVSELVKGGPV